MNKNSLLTLTCVLFIGCKSQHEMTYKSQIKESYIYAFKMNYFKNILQEGFNKSDEIKNILITDRSGYGESILSIDDIKLTDSLVKIDNSIMVQDSLDKIGKVAEGAQGKHVFSFAIEKYKSKWLDKLAKKRYKIFIQTHQKD